MKFRIAIFASGSGTNAEAIMQHFAAHTSIKVVLLLSNNPQAYALQRAMKFGVNTFVFDRKMFRDTETVLHELQKHDVTHIVLAGFMWLVPTYLVHAYAGKIINIHPALLPKFGGKGMYGMHVHEAVKTAGESLTGITIHEVNEHYDEGAVIFQASCEVTPTDSPDDIASKVHQLEYAYYPSTIESWILKSKQA